LDWKASDIRISLSGIELKHGKIRLVGVQFWSGKQSHEIIDDLPGFFHHMLATFKRSVHDIATTQTGRLDDQVHISVYPIEARFCFRLSP